MRTIDSIQPPAKRPSHPRNAHEAQATGTGARFTAFAKAPRRKSWALVLAVVLSPILFGLAQLGTIGIGLVVLYGLVAIVRRWPSRVVFSLSLAALVYTMVLQMAAATEMAQAMAGLAYTLLAVGAISLAIEIKMSSRVWFKKH